MYFLRYLGQKQGLENPMPALSSLHGWVEGDWIEPQILLLSSLPMNFRIKKENIFVSQRFIQIFLPHPSKAWV